MTYVSIAVQLKTLLQSITELSTIYDYEAKELNQYPCATLTASSHKNDFQDTAANRRSFVFTVRLYNRTDSASDGERIMRVVADKVMQTIEANVTLNGSCDWATPSEGVWGYQEREVPVRVCEITIVVLKRVVR